MTTALAREKAQYFDTWVANGGDGVVRAVWLGHNGGMPEREMEVGTSETTDGARWSSPRAVEDAKQDCPDKMRGCVDEPRGFLYVVYPAGPEHRWDIHLATSKDGGKSWSRMKVNDDASCANHMAPQAALDPKTGLLHVTWLENRSGKGALAYATCESGGAKCGANQAVSEPFASYSFARHSPEWLGEYGSLFVDTERRILHSVWTQTIDESGEPTARVFHAQAKLDP